MLLLVGLGNPGAKYQANRHNIGFLAADAIARAHHFGPARSRFQSEFCEGDINGEKVLLLKPQTYMNESGRAVGEALRFYKLAPKDVLVMHDELDLAPGKIRMKVGGGHGGHNGLRSIDAHIGKDYRRLRIGIGHPGHKDLVHHYVLSDFAKADAEWAKPLLDAIAAEAGWLAKGEDARFATAVSLRLSPPQKQTKAAPASPAGQVKD